MRRKERIRICELGVVANVANLIMCRLTGGLWLFVMLFESRIFWIMLRILFNMMMVYITRGWWLVCIALRVMLEPIIKDYIEERQKHKHRKKHRRS